MRQNYKIPLIFYRSKIIFSKIIKRKLTPAAPFASLFRGCPEFHRCLFVRPKRNIHLNVVKIAEINPKIDKNVDVNYILF